MSWNPLCVKLFICLLSCLLELFRLHTSKILYDDASGSPLSMSLQIWWRQSAIALFDVVTDLDATRRVDGSGGWCCQFPALIIDSCLHDCNYCFSDVPPSGFRVALGPQTPVKDPSGPRLTLVSHIYVPPLPFLYFLSCSKLVFLLLFLFILPILSLWWLNLFW